MGGLINMERGDYLDYGVSPRQRRVFVLRWNPTISSFSRDHFEIWFAHFKGNVPLNVDDKLDWSVWNWKEVNHRDLFVMMQVGQKVNGIVWGGFLGGYPYRYEHADGSTTKSIFFETTVMYMHRIEKTQILSAERLCEAIPNVDWLHGHSGELLSIEDAEKLGLFLFDELSRVEENDDIFFDSYQKKKYVLIDILTFMCPKLKERLLDKGKNRSPHIIDINDLMIRFDDNDYKSWTNIEDHTSLELLNGILT